ncbi:ACP S-malonyltransferase [Macrococcus epidermidis]|uniref:ACP S-malonyltransferase n=1 Tax=Macrococcus epidermidis TaxID=1902580 RepID=UPI001EF27104|nr:ACP S-malonyltransferase [Macrococcus epidermidis]MCG7419867.1 ACP S-malonyltransferase [Macrococcus epidermidis]
MSKVLMFPGQGSQYTGMANDIYNDATGKSLLNDLNAVLDEDIIAIMESGEKLAETENTQPAIVMHSIAALKLAQLNADYVIGHSLGEYAALVAAEVISPIDAVRIVRKRGQLMQSAFPPGVGSMAAIMGTDRDIIEKACQSLSNDNEKIDIANLNCPGQIVVAGHKTLIDKLVEAKAEHQIKKIIPLNVTGPFHSSLMKVIESEFSAFLDTIDFSDASIPVIQNVTALPVTDKDEIKANLVKQLYSPVEFTASIEYLLAQNADTFIEVGPGKVLSGLVRKIDRNTNTLQVDTLEQINEVKSWH